MDLNKTRTFVEVVHAGSVTKAAARLYRTQQAISYQLSALEDELGFSLFLRHGSNLTLTAEGRALFEQAKESITQLENTALSLQNVASSVSGTLRVGLWLEQGVTSLPAIFSEFLLQHAEARLELHLGSDQELEGKILADELDVAFMVFTQDKSKIRATPIFKRKLLLVASEAYLQTVRKPRCVRDTLDLDLIDYGKSHSAYAAWIRRNEPSLLGEARRKQPRVVVDNDLVLRALVQQGLGCAVLPEDAVSGELARREFIALLPRKTEAIDVGIDLCVHAGRTPNALVQSFSEFAISMALHAG